MEFSFQFNFLWYSSFAINFLLFFKWYFRSMKILLLRYPQNNYQIWIYKLNLMREELCYQIISISAVNQAVFWVVYISGGSGPLFFRVFFSFLISLFFLLKLSIFKFLTLFILLNHSFYMNHINFLNISRKKVCPNPHLYILP